MNPHCHHGRDVHSAQKASRIRVWETAVQGQNVEIKAETIESSRRDQTVKLIHIHFDKYVASFIVKIVNKAIRAREANNFNATVSSNQENGLTFLVNEIAIRSRYPPPGLCSLFAVRAADQFVFLCRIGTHF